MHFHHVIVLRWNQNSFDEIDTYTSLQKQLDMMKLVIAYYEKCDEALDKGSNIQALIKLPVREKIGRYKYVHEDNIKPEFDAVMNELDKEIADTLGKEDF